MAEDFEFTVDVQAIRPEILEAEAIQAPFVRPGPLRCLQQGTEGWRPFFQRPDLMADLWLDQ